MKKTLLILSMIVLFFAGCKKDDVIEASMVEITNETIERGWDYLKISAEYEYPEDLVAVTLYLSEKEDMSGAETYSCNVEGKTFSVEVKDLKEGTRYYYQYEYDNGYGKEKSEKENVATYAIVTKDVTNITATSATLNGSVTSSDTENKITAKGFCWGTEPELTIEGTHTNDGSGTGTYSSNLTNLTANTTYYVRAYATTKLGTAYGEERSFKTVEVTSPTVTTNNVTNITANSAVCGGNVTDDGNGTVTARGICWSEVQNPTINNIYSEETNNGTGTGSFTSQLTNLKENTTYYVRAYATNEKGTSYGEQKSFKTMEKPVNQTISVNGVSFTMIAVEGGTFNMGATSEQGSDADSDESPVHSVTLSDYYIGETEVTQELWEAVMGSNPSYFSGNPQRPVEYVSWYECKEFITNLNNLTGMNFRLPTEAEWEYAARGGNRSQGYKYSGSNTIGNVAWYDGNSASATHNVKTKSPNELGIYDMSGNVWEWCEDRYGNYSSGSQTNPTGPSTGVRRVFRGGSWSANAKNCRVSNRFNDTPGDRLINYGFRVVCLP